jgi:hypothetical protein
MTSMEIDMPRNVFFFLAIACGFISTAYASSKDQAIPLVCNVTRALDGKGLQFSVVLKESERTVSVNGFVYKNVRFSPYRVDGSHLSPNVRVPGVLRDTSISIDRMTGVFFQSSLPATENGSDFTEQQKELISSLPLDPSFAGTCVAGSPKF